MFMGEFAHNIDRKGRLILPAKFREDLNGRAVINRGLDGCLNVYTVDQWETVYQKIAALPSTDRNARMYQRMMFANAAELDLDAQGRINIPASLIKIGGIVKECMIIGVADHIEIWAKEKWDALQETEFGGSFEEYAEAVNGLMEKYV